MWRELSGIVWTDLVEWLAFKRYFFQALTWGGKEDSKSRDKQRAQQRMLTPFNYGDGQMDQQFEKRH